MKYRIIISLIIFFSYYLWPAGSADSAKTADKNKNSEPGTEIVFFADDFEKNVEKWIMSPGWKVTHKDGNAVIQSGPGGSIQPQTDNIPIPFSVSFRMLTEQGLPAFLFCINNGDHYVMEFPLHRMLLARVENGHYQEIHSQDLNYSAGKWYQFTIENDYGKIILKVNGKEVFNWEDENPLSQGNISFIAFDNARFYIDDLKITIESKSQKNKNIPYVGEWEKTNGPFGGKIHCVASDPSDSKTFFAAGAGGVIFFSRDRGKTWKEFSRVGEPHTQIHKIIVNKKDPDILYIIQEGHFFLTRDRGKKWILPEIPFWFSFLTSHPDNSSILLAGNREGKLAFSKDGGMSWKTCNPLPGGSGISSLPQSGIRDIAVSADGEFWIAANNLFYSHDLGESWENKGPEIHQDFAFLSIKIDNNNTREICIGLINIHNVIQQNIILCYKTKDKGRSWQPVKTENRDTDQRILLFDKKANRLLTGTGAHFFLSNYDGERFSDITPPGRTGDGSNELALHPDNPDLMIFPTPVRGGIIRTQDGGETWEIITDGIDNCSISLFASSENTSTIYATSVGGQGVFKSTNSGDTWKNVSGNGITHFWGDEIAISPHNPNEVLYIADVGEVFHSLNQGQSWIKSIDSYGGDFTFGSVYALAPAPSDGRILYAVKSGFGIFKSTDTGRSWQFLHQSEIDYTYTLAVHPDNPRIVLSGYNPKPFETYAKIRMSTDGGDTWTTPLKIPGASAVTSVEYSRVNPNIVFAGSTGEGGTVWRSTDGGESWQKTNSSFDFTNLHFFTTDPHDPELAFGATWGGGTWITPDGGETWERLKNDPTISASAVLVSPGEKGRIFLSDRTSPKIFVTSDSGENWDIFYNAGSKYYRVLSSALSADGKTLYASIFRKGGPMEGDIFKIEGGTSHIITHQVPRIPVALTTSGKNTIYAVCHGYGVYYSPNKGKTWMDISGEGLPEDPPVGFNGLVVDPQDENVLYLFGGCDIGMDLKARGVRLEKMNTIYKSENRGKSWTNLNTGLFGKNSGAIKSLSIHPQKSTHLYAGTLNGVYFSNNGGKSWQDITDKLPYIHTAGVYLNSNGEKIYAATLGGGVYTGIIQNNSVKWSSQSNLKMQVHHVQVTTHPKDPAIIYASAYPGGVFKSMNQGKTWSEANFGLASFAIKDPLRQGYYAFAISATKPNILYLGMYGVGMYKSLDKGDTWLPVNGKNSVMAGKAITSLLIDPDNPARVWVTTEEGLHQTEDGGQKWEELSSPGEKSQLRLIKMNKEKKLFVSRLGYELYRSDNAGKDWRPINGFGNFGTFWPIWDDRPLYQYTSLVFHPQDPDILLFGTFPAGIFKSRDKGKTWRESNAGWTNDGVFSMVFHPKDRTIIYCGTYNGVNRSIDTGDSWEVWDKGWPDEQWVFSIDFDPRNPDVMYACSKNGENEGRGREDFRGTVMKSTNGGHDWFPVTKGLDVDQEFYKILVDPHHPDFVYLATQRDGVFISEDRGETWRPWNEGLTNTYAGTNGNNVTNNMVFSSDKKYIFFGSFGSGIFRRQTIGTAYQ